MCPHPLSVISGIFTYNCPRDPTSPQSICVVERARDQNRKRTRVQAPLSPPRRPPTFRSSDSRGAAEARERSALPGASTPPLPQSLAAVTNPQLFQVRQRAAACPLPTHHSSFNALPGAARGKGGRRVQFIQCVRACLPDQLSARRAAYTRRSRTIGGAWLSSSTRILR